MKILLKIFSLTLCFSGISGTAFASATRDASVGLQGHYKLVSPIVATYSCNPPGSEPGQQNGMYWTPQISPSPSAFTFSIFGPYGSYWNTDNSGCPAGKYYFTLWIKFQIQKDNDKSQTCTIYTGMKWHGSSYYYDHTNLPASTCDGGARISQCNGTQWEIGDHPPMACGNVHPS